MLAIALDRKSLLQEGIEKDMQKALKEERPKVRKKALQDDSLRETTLAREKNILAIALDRKSLLQEGIEKDMQKALKEERPKVRKKALQQGMQKGMHKKQRTIILKKNI